MEYVGIIIKLCAGLVFFLFGIFVVILPFVEHSINILCYKYKVIFYKKEWCFLLEVHSYGVE